jgi:adenosylcobinamide kinase/adenosylcobinamide-phosphate guanylyltransferase
VTNLLLGDHNIPAAVRTLIEIITIAQGEIILVSNEVGLGIVPENQLARRFRDEAGILHQRVAACAKEVQLLCAGLNLQLK